MTDWICQAAFWLDIAFCFYWLTERIYSLVKRELESFKHVPTHRD